MQKGEILDLEIVSSGMNGEGVAKIDGFVIFIPNTLIGEYVRVELTLVKKSFANAKVIKILNGSEHRKKPLCPIFYKCGSCELQHINYAEQLAVKRANLIACLEKECRMTFHVEQVVFGEMPFGYRNKIQVPIMRDKEDRISVGYFKPNSHIQVQFGQLNKEEIENSDSEYCVPYNRIDIENIGNCPLHSKVFQKIIDAFCEYAEEENLSCYDEFYRQGLLRHIVIRRVEKAYSIIIVVNGNAIPNVEKMIKKFNKIVNNYSLFLCKNTKDTNVILTDEIKTLYGQPQISAEILGIKVKVSPVSFLQINDEIRDKIYQKVNKIIENAPKSIVIDLYSGIGILSNIMTISAEKVYAVEIVRQAVEDANKIALLNNNQNKIVNICGDAAQILPNLVNKIKKECLAQDFNLNHLCQEHSNKNVVSLCSNMEKYTVEDRNVVNDNFKVDDCEVRNAVNGDIKNIVDLNKMKVENAFEVDFKNRNFNINEEKFAIQNVNAVKNIEACNTIENNLIQGCNSTIIVVIDPPRKGCDSVVLESILNAAPNKIIYISCNPATLSRDLKVLISNYSVESITPYDMFPQTSHIETLVVLCAKS